VVLLSAAFLARRIAHCFRAEDSSKIAARAVNPSHAPVHEILLSDGLGRDLVEAHREGMAAAGGGSLLRNV